MGFMDKVKQAAETAKAAAETATEKGKEMYEKNAENRAEKKAADEAHRIEMQGIAGERANALIEAMEASGQQETFFKKAESVENVLKYTKDFFDKIFLPAIHLNKTYVNMYPYVDDRDMKKIVKSMGIDEPSTNIILHLKDKEKQEFILTIDNFYFKLPLVEDKNFYAMGVVPMSYIHDITFVKANDSYEFLCNDVMVASLKIYESLEEDFVSLNKYFTDLKNHDLEITDEEVNQIIIEKIGQKIYGEIKKYMIFDDEKLVYFGWGADSISAKDYIVCTDKQIVIMNRAAFGATADVKQLYYEDITSAQTLQNSNSTSLLGYALDVALTSALKLCDLVISVAGNQTKISTLTKIEAERVVAIYHYYRKMRKDEAKQPQVVQQVVAPQPQADPMDQLSKLAKMKEAGIISEEEFAEKKEKLLGMI